MSEQGNRVSGLFRPDYTSLLEVDPEHYIFGKEIARGGQGRIRAAHDRRLGRQVAIKELIAEGQRIEARFEREIRLTARLQHPGIPSVYEAGRWPTGRPFYAMRLVNGRGLGDVLAELGDDIEQRLAHLPALIAVVEAMGYAHSQGILHRDLEPSNIMLGAFGEVVVLDWGLAKDIHAPDGAAEIIDPLAPDSSARRTPVTIAGTVIGTPAYMPPEQAGGEPVDARADVFSLGALIYHLLSGVPPYQADNPLKVIFAVLKGPPPPLVSHQPHLPPDLVALVDKAMCWDASGRYPSAQELADELTRFQTGQLVAAHRYTWIELAQRFFRGRSRSSGST